MIAGSLMRIAASPASLAVLPALIIPFKRPVYERVVAEFAKFAKT